MTRAIAYARVSTARQGESGLGLEAQQATVEAHMKGAGWERVGWYVDVASGKSMERRPQLEAVLRRLAAGEADLLVVAKLDRLSRSLVDFADMMARAKAEGWGVAALDIGIDTSTLNGELVANIIMALAQWERQLIGQRITAALAMTRERGTTLGRPSGVSPETLSSIIALRGEGRSWREIARALTTAKIPTAQGGVWRASTVSKLYEKATGGGDGD